MESRVRVVCDDPTEFLEKAETGHGTPGKVLTWWLVLKAQFDIVGAVPPTGASVITDS